MYVDGGVRTAEHVLAGLALGAQLVFVGRPVLWALACGGADGVQAWLDGLTDGLAHVMALAGAASRGTRWRASPPLAGPADHDAWLTRPVDGPRTRIRLPGRADVRWRCETHHRAAP